MSATDAPQGQTALGTGLLAVGLVLAGVAAYLWTMDVPWLRSTGAAALPPMLLGVGVGLRAVARDGRRRVRLAAFATLLMTVGWVWAFYGYARLPAPAESATAAVRAPAFALPASDGARVAFDDDVRAGPTLLVFYRGAF